MSKSIKSAKKAVKTSKPAARAPKKKKASVQPGSGNLFDTHNERPRFTGRIIVTMNEDTNHSSIRSFAKATSLKIPSIRDFASSLENYHEAFNQGDGIYFDTFKIAIINTSNEDAINKIQKTTAATAVGFSKEPERYVYAWATTRRIAAKPATVRSALPFIDNDISTWGIQAIKLLNSSFTGKNINVAVLDTGLNLAHPDFARLTIQSKSFIKNQKAEDGNGHGTHCSGIAAGAINKKNGKRYGVASDANLFIGKVLSNAGRGDDSGILAGIEWALQNKCKVISMSLGSAVNANETYSPAYERVAKVALQNGCIIVAAAGNESQRQFGIVKPVGHPANCPSIMAVGAVDNNLKIAYFSCGGLNPDGGQVDIAAPGVNVYSSWKGKDYNTISGTSMATPFVAGVAATYWQAFPQAKASDIWMMLTQNTLRLPINSTDVGAGLLRCIK